MISSVVKIPYIAVADAVRARLDAGEWLPGEQVPSARQLGQEYGVSRNTAAKAMRLLADEGRLTILRAYGAFVPEQGS